MSSHGRAFGSVLSSLIAMSVLASGCSSGDGLETSAAPAPVAAGDLIVGRGSDGTDVDVPELSNDEPAQAAGITPTRAGGGNGGEAILDPLPEMSADGIRLPSVPGSDRYLWTQPDPSRPACEGRPGWSVWSVPEAGDDLYLATATVFSSLPVTWVTADGGIVLISACEEQSWQVVSARLSGDGTLSDEREITPIGFEDFAIADVFFRDGSQTLVFRMIDRTGDGSTSTVAVVDPTTGAIETSFVVGDPAVGCSAQSLELDVVRDPNLTGPAAATRTALIEAATQCDFAALGELSRTGITSPDAELGTDPATWWALGEQLYGEIYTAQLAQWLAGPSERVDFEGRAAYQWPIGDDQVIIAEDGEWLSFYVGG